MNVISIVIQIFILLFAITVHEAAHGWAAKKLGDPTAFNLGRVTLNPIAHIDPFGTILLPLLLSLTGLPPFGWAKPVPVNPYNFRNPRRDTLWVSFAGPVANIIVALSSLILLFLMKLTIPSVALFLRNPFQQIFAGLSPLARGFSPLDGLSNILLLLVIINSYLALFNLIPVPPLDGSGILTGLLPESAAARFARIPSIVGFLIILLLINLRVLDIIERFIVLMIMVVLG